MFYIVILSGFTACEFNICQQFYARKDNPIIGCINRSRGTKTREGIIPGDQKTVGLTMLVILHGEQYI